MNLLESIKNNLEFLGIKTIDKSINQIIDELDKEEEYQGLAQETILKINLYLKGGKNNVEQ